MSVTVTEADLADRLAALPAGRRSIVAVAGAPGSGKSTIAEALVARLNAGAPGRAALLPMDGYHYDNDVLSDLGRLAHKGAPDTFDVGGLYHTLTRLRAAAEDHVAVPIFDRSIEIAKAGAQLIACTVDVVVAEGNYLLLQDPPWDRLDGLFDVTVRLEVPEAELRRRLTARWVGFGLDEAAIAHKLDGNDLPNGRAVRDRSRPADLVVHAD